MANYSVISWNLGNARDRFLSTGYKESQPVGSMVQQADSIEGIKGLELVGTRDITLQTAGELLDKYNMKCISIIPDDFSQKQSGTMT